MAAERGGVGASERRGAGSVEKGALFAVKGSAIQGSST